MRTRRGGVGSALVLALLVLLGPGCATSNHALPSPPATPQQNLGPSEPPVIWIGGTLSGVSPDALRVTEPVGSVVNLRRLTGTATSFFRVSGDSWQMLGRKERVDAGQHVCVETLMDGATLLALRVFLGSDCGPR